VIFVYTQTGPVRKLCLFSAAFSGAVFFAVYLLPGSLLLPLAGVFALLIPLSFLLRANARKRALLLTAGVTFGIVLTAGYTCLVRAPAAALVGQEDTYTMEVTGYPIVTSWGGQLSVQLQGEDSAGPALVLYAGEDALELCPGDRISAEVRLQSAGVWHGENSDYYPSRGVELLGYADGELILIEHPDRLPLRYWPQKVSKVLKAALLQCFPPDVSGTVTALITGDKQTLPTGLYAAFRRSGIAHVVAVSGLHVSFLAGFLTTILGKRRRLSAGLGIALVFFFAAVAGNTPSVLRAAFMESFLLIAPLVDREPDKPTTLSVVLMLVLLPNPFAARSLSLQLSFAAVAGIYLLTGPLYTRWMKIVPKGKELHRKLLRALLAFLFGTLATTLGALLFTTPLCALAFHSISLAGPLTNLLTLWAVSDGFLGGLLAALLFLVCPAAGRLLAEVVGWPLRWVILAARTISRLPFAALSLSSLYLISWFLLAYSIVLLTLFGPKPRPRPSLSLSVCLITLCVSLIMAVWSARSSTLTVAALDVGQGASTLFYSKGHAVLVDCGGNSGDDPGDIAADYLQTLGTSRLDALILTHFHADHANGVLELLERLEVDTLLLPDVEAEDPLRQDIQDSALSHSCKVFFLSAETALDFGGVHMELFEPFGDGGSNEEGLSVLCRDGDFDVLVTGDMNSVVERRLVKYKGLPDIEVLMVGHHGSKDSTSEELLLAVTPEIAVISSGYNSYGHPSNEVLERLGAAGCDIYLTRDMGTVTLIHTRESG